jgi:hypothetical protein
MVTFFNSLDAIRWCLACQKGLLELKWPDELNRLPYSSTVLGKNGSMTTCVQRHVIKCAH